VATIRLGKRAIDALSPREKPYVAFDAVAKGFGVMVMPSGVKTFILEYRPGAGGRAVAKKRLRLGRFGAMTPEQGRQAALTALAAIRLGDDPQAEKGRQRAALTVAQLIDAFLDGHGGKLKVRTADGYRDALAKLKAAHGADKATALTRAQVAALHSRLSETPYAANRLLSAASKMFAWAESLGHIPEDHPNPARKIDRYKERGRERFLTSEEFGRLGDALRAAETVGLVYAVDESKPASKHARKPEKRLVMIDPFAVAAIRLLLLTGARLREILHARLEWIDWERATLFLPDSKTDRKPIYLSPAAKEVLNVLPRLEGNPYIIPSLKKDGGCRADLKRPWEAITKAARLEGLRLHDVRHSFASVGVGGNLGLPILGKLLGHSSPSTTQKYAHLASDLMQRATEAIGATISAAMNREPGAEIVDFARAKK
jgi:integrase